MSEENPVITLSDVTKVYTIGTNKLHTDVWRLTIINFFHESG